MHTGSHTHVEQNKLNGDNHFHIYCMYKNKPTDSFRLQISGVFQSFQEEKKKMIVGGLKQPEPQLVWIPVGAPGSPRKYQILHWGCGGWMWVSAQRSHRYACGVRCFLRRGGTVSFQPLKEKQTPPWKVELRRVCSSYNAFTLKIFGFSLWANKTSYLALHDCTETQRHLVDK